MSPRAFVLMVLLAPLAAWSQPRGVDFYKRGQYEKAIDKLQREADDPSSSPKEQALARVYLAASMHALGMKDEARAQLEELARRHPEQRVDTRRFPPDFVELADLARGNVEAERLRAEAQAQETEQRRSTAVAEPSRSVEAWRENEPQSPRAGSDASFRLRPEVFGYVDMLGQGARGFGVGVSLGYGGLDSSARLLPGPDGRWGIGLELGYLLGNGLIQPRIALRGTLVTGVGVGGGGTVGVRVTPWSQLTFLVDVGVEKLAVSAPERFRSVLLTASAGVGVPLL
ncbi:hypothetical protein D187_008951 [Cystobacter fuscus DSM 2262]|uniref:Tetratricopeptide repeat protein n=1 Tax=Cystobacter fuscus (strain ATCC 25194 / DSM 2262 / NBRC 100088 / M29) TaxID=1242864 RepID=S9R1J9_CYSF2|nr:hypothetical protein [Cystobacter fuscus]EPX62763.1 hypothetical protein D187_008951 [Cystobacter fuscus DSM 2262]